MVDEWKEATPPESLVGLRKAVERNTERCNAAADYSARTYHLVAPLVKRMRDAEQSIATIQRRGYTLPVLAASLALAASIAGLACEVLR